MVSINKKTGWFANLWQRFHNDKNKENKR